MKRSHVVVSLLVLVLVAAPQVLANGKGKGQEKVLAIVVPSGALVRVPLRAVENSPALELVDLAILVNDRIFFVSLVSDEMTIDSFFDVFFESFDSFFDLFTEGRVRQRIEDVSYHGVPVASWLVKGPTPDEVEAYLLDMLGMMTNVDAYSTFTADRIREE